MTEANEDESPVPEKLFRWWQRFPSPVRYLGIVGIYLVGWTLLDKVALAFESKPEISVWYPPSALDLVLTLVFGWRYSPALLLNTPIHNFIVTGRNFNSVALLVFDAVTTLGYAGASALLLYKLRINPRLRRLRDIIWFVVVATLAAPLFISLLQALNFAYFGIIPWSEFWLDMLHYWAGDATGIAMLAPFLLTWLRHLPWLWSQVESEPPTRETEPHLPKRREARELLLESLSLGAAIGISYGTRPSDEINFTYFVFLPLIWSALRHGFEKATTMILLINVGVVLIVRSLFGQSDVLALQFGLMAISLTGLLLGGIASERKQTDKALRDSADRLAYNAFHDALTGLPNRALFIELLTRAIDRRKRDRDYLFAVLFLDLNQFKVINDSLGHSLGDLLLIAIAQNLETCLRPSDTIARLGGDEFTILLDELSDIRDAIRITERLQTALRFPITLDGHEVFTTASIGIAFGTPDYHRPEDLLRDADIAMYRAKIRGQRYEIFNASMHERALVRFQVETELRRAIERQEFLVYFQPIVSLATGRVTGFEALVRWQHPERGLLSPAHFVLIAEETGLLDRIDRWVMREACRQVQQWSQQMSDEFPLLISVNLANKQFAQPNLVEQIDEILQETGLEASCLKLEITEEVIMENDESAITKLEQLKALGVQLSIDDFGIGYSSLSRLHRFPLDELKIDRSFITPIGFENSTFEIAETIITLAQKLALNVTAEGIETAEQLAQLRQLNCPYGQGYFFSRPLNCQAAAALLAARPQW
jgi:diguanylate cyclase (GGDEF)-like protein